MKKVKKILALLLAMCMVFALCACGGDGDDGKDSDKDDKVGVSDKGNGKDKDGDKDKELTAEELIVGDWEAKFSMLVAMEMAGVEDLDIIVEYFDFDSVSYVMSFSFDEDGNYTLSMKADEDEIEEVLREGMVKLIEEELEISIADAAAEEGMTEDELVDALVEELFGDVSDMANFNSQRGTYKLDGDKLYMDDDEDSYATFKVDSDELTLIASYTYGEKDDSPLYPLTFERV